jgi:hypothetical protein
MDNIDKLIHDITHLTVDQMLELVKKSGNYNDRRFRATGPKGSMEGVILDAFLELLQFDGVDGFMMANDFRFANDITFELI